MPDRSDKPKCLTKVPDQSTWPKCLTELTNQSAWPKWLITVPNQRAWPKWLTNLPDQIDWPKCLTKVPAQSERGTKPHFLHHCGLRSGHPGLFHLHCRSWMIPYLHKADEILCSGDLDRSQNLTSKYWFSIYYRFCTVDCEKICTLFNFSLWFLLGSAKIRLFLNWNS